MMTKTGRESQKMTEGKTGSQFPVEFARIRKAMGYSQRQAAAILGRSERTVRGWESGTSPDDDLVQVGILIRLRTSRQAPSQRKREALKRSHHIYWEEGRGWVMRFTLEINRKLVGKRIKIRLRTHCLEEAIKRRELIVLQYRKLGFKVSVRRQRRRSTSFSERRV